MTPPAARRRRSSLLAAAVLAVGSAAALAGTASAATPSSGTLTASSTPGGTATQTWTGTLVQGGATAGDSCLSDPTSSYDEYDATIAYPAGVSPSSVTATFSENATADDTILEVADSTGKSLAVSDNGSVGTAEQVSLSAPAAGTYKVLTCSYSGGGPYSGTATLTTAAASTGGPVGGTSTTAGPATFGNYDLSSVPGTNQSGEPSIGVDWQTGNVYFQANLNTVKAVFPASGTGAPALSDVSCFSTTLQTLDPIMYTDPTVGRVQVSQLTGADSISAYFDDATAAPTGPQTTCTPSQGGGIPSGPDHQTLGAGPYPSPLPTGVTGPLTSDPHAVYYCSQGVVTAFCARSDNGGLSFGPGVPIYTTADGCGGLHGHVRVGPDGAVYVPNKSCNTHAGIAVSKDAGLTWTVHQIPGSSSGDSDPSVTTDAAGRVYAIWADSDGKPAVSTSDDDGTTWTTPVHVGDAAGIVQSHFVEAIGGGPGRAAVAFLGSTTPGASGSDPAYGEDSTGTTYTGGRFDLYVAITIDGGRTYRTVDATPTDPVQRGEICTAGTTCTGNTRNLLDFNDIAVDKTGHVLVGYADGCTGACVTSTKVSDNTLTSQGYIARELSGPLLFDSGAATAALPDARTPVALVLLALAGGCGLLGWRRLRGRTA